MNKLRYIVINYTFPKYVIDNKTIIMLNNFIQIVNLTLI